MLAAAERWGGGEDERPFLPRAFSVMRHRHPHGLASPHAAAGGGEAAPHGPASPHATAGGGEAAPHGPASPHAAAGGGEAAPGGRLEFMLEDVGPGTHRLGELRPGDGLWLAGPFGIGFAPPRDGRRPLLVGGGVGTAPLAIWHDALGEAEVLLGFRDRDHAHGASLLRGARVATDDGSAGHQGPVTDLLLAELGRDPHAEVYACGPPAMLEAVRAICADHEIPAQLALESGMACGYGACFGCVVPTKNGYVRLCVDGPVLHADTLERV
jgi:NAD(P)H-flavin reductase